MGPTSDAERRFTHPDETNARMPEPTGERKRLPVEETLLLILTQSPWEPMEPLVADIKQNPLKLPEWFDAETFAKGQRYFQNNVFSMLAGKLVGLVALLRIDTISRILHGTERSITERTACKRYADTLKHTVIWYDEDPTDEGSWADSLLEVRGKHAKVVATNKTVEKPPLSQFDLAMTQFAFCGAILLRPNELGLDPTPDDIRGFIHFWRVIGFLVGINNKYNLCNQDQDPAYTLELLDLVRAKVFSPLLLQPHTEVSENLTKCLLNGMWCLVPLLEVTSFETITKELLADLSEKEISSGRKALKLGPAILRYFFFWLQGTFHTPILGLIHRKYHNTSMRFGMYMIQNYPLLAWWKFGFSYRPSTG